MFEHDLPNQTNLLEYLGNDMNAIKPLRIFIGYDHVERISFHTLVQSIIDKSSIPVTVCPISLDNLKGIYRRTKDSRQSNSFSFSRFLVPYLCNYEGIGLFMDCDMMLRVNIAELLDSFDENKAVSVVKHDYEPKNSIKYLGNVQHNYPRKNWSSFVLWNCGHPKNAKVTPEFVNNAPPAELHRFLWLDDSEIGELPVEWNWLVGEYDDPPSSVKNVHWTVGGPYFTEYSNVDYADEWLELKESINYCKQLNE